MSFLRQPLPPLRATYLASAKPVTSFPPFVLEQFSPDKKQILLSLYDELFHPKTFYQEQIEIVLKNMYVKGSHDCNFEKLGMLFDISKATMREHYSRMLEGHREVGRPALLNQDQAAALFDYLGE